MLVGISLLILRVHGRRTDGSLEVFNSLLLGCPVSFRRQGFGQEEIEGPDGPLLSSVRFYWGALFCEAPRDLFPRVCIPLIQESALL